MANTKNKRGIVVFRDWHRVVWGFSGQRVRRMHLRPLDHEYLDKLTVWLEDGAGNRSFEPDGDATNFDLTRLRQFVRNHRDVIEARWLGLCRSRNWLRYDADAEEIVLYPGTPQEIRRSLLDVDGVPKIEAQWEVNEDRVRVEYLLNGIIWRGAENGSDAVVIGDPLQK